MKIATVIGFATTLLAANVSLGAAPVLHASKTVTINASASAVWKVVKDFDALGAWHPAVAKDEILEGTNNTVGAVRLLTLKGGGTIKEKLLAYNAAGRTFKYSIIEGVLPVSSYTSTVVVASAGKGQCKVTWSGRFKRKNVGDSPADNENDKSALDTINSVYQAGLDNLKKMLESQ